MCHAIFQMLHCRLSLWAPPLRLLTTDYEEDAVGDVTGVTSATRRRLPRKVTHPQRPRSDGHSLGSDAFLISVARPVDDRRSASGVCAGGTRANAKWTIKKRSGRWYSSTRSLSLRTPTSASCACAIAIIIVQLLLATDDASAFESHRVRVELREILARISAPSHIWGQTLGEKGSTSNTKFREFVALHSEQCW